MPEPAALAADGLRRLAAQLRAQALATNVRHGLVLAGSPGWTLAAAAAALAALPACETLWLSDRPLPGRRLPLSGGAQVLGAEIDVLVYDAEGGFDPDSLAAAAGSIRGGGLLLLLTPPLADWPDRTDPQAARVAVHPFTAGQVGGRYLRRLVRLLPEAPGMLIAGEGEAVLEPADEASTPAMQPAATAAPHPAAPGPRTADQARALALILETARGRARRPLVITSDRGRGKSSVLGLAAASLLSERGRRILVTAPRRSAVEPLFAQAARLLPGAAIHADRIDAGDGTIAFVAPDALCRSAAPADLLLVDEAAGIPGPLLAHLLQTHPRVVFATTVQGYEGTGRGFDLRFRRTLNRDTPGWRELRLTTPVRWAEDDPLEAALGRLLMLDADPSPIAALAEVGPDRVSVERLDRDSLTRDEETLRALFGLLVLAHYQTRPMDLRHLLDGPNLQVYALRHHHAVAATALAAVEGRLDARLAQAVFEGRRRPRGHLLPQTLSAHAGMAEAARLGYVRVVRIAVHPAVRDRGLARHLLEGIAADAAAAGLDLIGASFGADPELLRFWTHCGFRPAHLGTRRNAASGAHALVVLKSLTAEGARFESAAGRRLGERLPVLLAGPLRGLSPALVGALLAAAPESTVAGPDAAARREILAFAQASRPFEAVLPPLSDLTRSQLGPALRAGQLGEAERDALIALVLQHRNWSEAARITGASGRAGLIALLRRGAETLLAANELASLRIGAIGEQRE